MLQKDLTREEAEERYGSYLVNPTDFALQAGEEVWKADGYKNWEEAAIGRSVDPEATKKRIEELKKKSQLIFRTYCFENPELLNICVIANIGKGKCRQISKIRLISLENKL